MHAASKTIIDIVHSIMLAGRAFQGAGSGVILSLVEIVLSDLVPLSERYVTPRTYARFVLSLWPTGEVFKVLSVPFGLWPLQQVGIYPRIT